MRLAVVDAAAGEEAQQAPCCSWRGEVGVDVARRSGRMRVPSEIALLLLLLHRRRLRRGRSRGPGARRCVASSISWMIAGSVSASLSIGAGQRIAAERAEAHHASSSASRRARSGMRSSSTMISVPSRSTTGRVGGEVERHDRDVLEVDVLPDVELGPVRQREDADALALVLAGVVEAPQLGPLVLRVPAVAGACGRRRCAPWRGTSPRRGGRRRRPRRSRTCRAPASGPAVFHDVGVELPSRGRTG